MKIKLFFLILCSSFLIHNIARGQTTIFSENFDGAWSSCEKPTASWSSTVGCGNEDYSTYSIAWHRSDNTGNLWSLSSSGGYSPSGANSTSFSARFHSYAISASANAVSLITPVIDLSAYTSISLKFYYINVSGSDNLKVYFSNDGGANWGTATTYTIQASWTQQTLSIGSSYYTNNFKIKFEAKSDYGDNDIGLDQIIVEGTQAGSTESDIVSAGGETSNIDYASKQSSSITATTDAIKVWSFTLRDGGGDFTDADAFATNIASLVIKPGGGNTQSWSNSIRQAAIYKGATEVAEITVSAETMTFSGLTTLTCADADANGETFDLYLTFETAVTDNSIYQFTIAAADVTVAASSTSGMTAFTTISSSTTDPKNKIEVTATKLLFVQQPTTTSQNVNMTPAVTVEAVDANNKRDLDFANSISITSNGTLSSSPQTAAASSGISTFSTINHTATATGRALTAVYTGLTSATSNTFDITASVSCTPISTFPYTENFDAASVPALPSCWAMEDIAAEEDDWKTSITNPASSPNCLFISWDNSVALNDWAFSPEFTLTSGTSYQITFKYRSYGSFLEKLKLCVGTAQTSVSMTTTLATHELFSNDTYATSTSSFTPSTTGSYYFGWNAYSDADMYGIFVDDITIAVVVNGQSDIVTASNEATDIDYTQRMENTLATTTEGTRVWSFTIRDGGAGSPDADALNTNFTSLVIEKGASNTATWATTIKKASLFDGSTLVANSTIDVTAETMTFSGISLAAADDLTKTYDLYINFESTQTDNAILQFKLRDEGVTIGAGSNPMADFSIESSTLTNKGRIVVTATALAFVQQPTTTLKNAAMTPTVTVKAVDANGNLDVNWATNITITSTGTLTGTPVAAAPASGVSSFATLTHTAVGLGRQLTANSTGLTQASSSVFDITSSDKNIYGYLRYAYNTPIGLSGQTVDLHDGSSNAKTTTTDMNGYFQFTEVATGTYSVRPTVSITVDEFAVTAKDLTTYLKHTAGHEVLVSGTIKFKSGDVELDNDVEGLDVQNMKQKIVGIATTTWPSTNFALSNTDAAGAFTTFAVAASDVNLAISTLLYGDADASFSMAKNGLQNALITSDEPLLYENGEDFILPIRIKTDINNLSSVTAKIGFNTEAITVTEVTMLNNQSITYSINDGIIKLVYANLNTTNIEAEEIMFYLKGNINKLDYKLQAINYFALELGDYDANTIENPVLEIPELSPYNTNNISDKDAKITIFPNPANDNIFINNVKDADIIIYDMLGKIVSQKHADDNNISITTSDMTEGTYFVKIIKKNFTTTHKLIVN